MTPVPGYAGDPQAGDQQADGHKAGDQTAGDQQAGDGTRRAIAILVAVAGLVVAGIFLAVLYALAGGFDTLGWVLFALLVFQGALTIAAVWSSRSRRVGPVTCEVCGGLVSRNAPYCKHCGARPGS